MRPEHYKQSKLEPIDAIKGILHEAHRDPYRGFLIGNIIKYLCRSPYKGNSLEDIEKAQTYLDWLKDTYNVGESRETT